MGKLDSTCTTPPPYLMVAHRELGHSRDGVIQPRAERRSRDVGLALFTTLLLCVKTPKMTCLSICVHNRLLATEGRAGDEARQAAV
jgi:hypothetical protein